MLSPIRPTSCCCETECRVMVGTSCLFSCKETSNTTAAQKNTFFNKNVFVTASITAPFVILSYLYCCSSTCDILPNLC